MSYYLSIRRTIEEIIDYYEEQLLTSIGRRDLIMGYNQSNVNIKIGEFNL